MAIGPFGKAMLGNTNQQLEDIVGIQEMLSSGAQSIGNLAAKQNAYVQEAYGLSNAIDSIYKPSELYARTPTRPHWDKVTTQTTVQKIMEMRAELEELINGDNPLNKFLSRVTVREMIKELRTDIRIMKYENKLTELDIIKNLKGEADERTREPAPFPGGGFPSGPIETKKYFDEFRAKEGYKTNPYTGETTESSN